MSNVLVIGGGIAGMQASLDLAERGLKVYLIEKEPSIGGHMAQLDKTFPTNDCAMCLLGPKMLDCLSHEGIEILPYSEVVEVSGKVGRFEVKVSKKPRYVNEERCTGCDACAKACLLRGRIPNEYDVGLGKRGAVYIPFPQAVPHIAIVDERNCVFITRGVCGKAPACIEACERDAIDFDQKEKKIELDVGAIIVAIGVDSYEPSEYGYNEYENVITALEYERLISASGPTGGNLFRPSDKEVPKRIGFIQCVGSRDTKVGNSYCSSVCCMYATKEAVLAKERYSDIIPYIFYTDLRLFGKGFQEYVDRAKIEYGVHYVRSRPSEVIQDPETKNLTILHSARGKVTNTEVDLVVLATALIPSKTAEKLSNILTIELDNYGFFKSKDELCFPVASNVPGVFICGACEGSKDIPQSIVQASAAASRVAECLK